MRNKYGNQKTTVDGIVFDSKKEAARYGELLLLSKAGKIYGLRLQVPFVLAPSVFVGGRKRPALRYVADFRYFIFVPDGDTWKTVVEDCKGCRTDAYRIKRHLMKSVHNIDILET